MNGMLRTGIFRLGYGLFLLFVPLLTSPSRVTWFGITLLAVTVVEGLNWWLSRRKGQGGEISLITAVVSLLFGLMAFIPAAKDLVSWFVTIYLAYLALAELVTWMNAKGAKRQWLLWGALLSFVAALVTLISFSLTVIILLMSLALIGLGICRVVASMGTSAAVEEAIHE